MTNILFRVWKEDEWFLSEIVGRENEIYAQGTSYADSLSNLFSVLKEINELNEEESVQSKKERKKTDFFPKEGISFSIPVLVK